MRKSGYWTVAGTLSALVLALWGTWTWRLTETNRNLTLQMEAERQRNFADMAYHVEEIQALLGKGIVTGTIRQNMRYMSDVNLHASAAAANFSTLPLPAQISAATGKFLTQTGDFAASILRNEAAGRDMTAQQRDELARLRKESAALSVQLHRMGGQYARGEFRWNPPVRLSWASLVRRPGASTVRGKPATGSQAPSSLTTGGWTQLSATMEKLPVMLYDGPFSDSVAKRVPSLAGPPLTQADAAARLRQFLPNAATYRTVSVEEVTGTLPAISFRLAPSAGPAGSAYTTVAEVAKNGGYPLMLLNNRVIGKASIDLPRAKRLGEEYLAAIGYPGMTATYGAVNDGTATVAFAFRQNDVVVYPDQIKLKIALDTGEIMGLDARQYIMNHHARSIKPPVLSAAEAQDTVSNGLVVQRAQLALIPNQSGTGEVLTWEFLGKFANETYLIYINTTSGQEEQLLQQIETDGGTFAL